MEGNILKKKKGSLIDKLSAFLKFGKKPDIETGKSKKELISEYDDKKTPKKDEKDEALKSTQGAGEDQKTEQSEVKDEEPLVKFNFSLSDNKTLGTNLIKNELTTFFDWKKNIGFLFFSLLTPCLIIAFVYGLIIFWEKNEEIAVNSIGEDIKNKEQLISQAETNIEMILDFQERIKNARTVLNNHIYWSNLFQLLEDNTLANVEFSGLAGTLDGEFTLSATAKSNYFVATDQVRLFKDEGNYIRSAVTGGGTKSEDEEGSAIDFEVELKIDPKIFTSDYVREHK